MVLDIRSEQTENFQKLVHSHFVTRQQAPARFGTKLGSPRFHPLGSVGRRVNAHRDELDILSQRLTKFRLQPAKVCSHQRTDGRTSRENQAQRGDPSSYQIAVQVDRLSILVD